MIDLDEAKQRLPIPDLWRLIGLEGEPADQCRSPFREDRNPSFSIYADGTRWRDFSTGEGGDAVDFLAVARGLSNADGIREFIALAGGREPAATTPKPYRRTLEKPKKGNPRLPELSTGTPGDWKQLAELRGLSEPGIARAVALGLVRFADWHERRIWVATDATRRNAQARRLDGEMFPAIGKLAARKSHTFAGSEAGLPLGLPNVKGARAVLVVEGGPDLLAACDCVALSGVRDIASVGILGASNRLSRETLAILQGRRVRIFPHADDAGRAAGERWQRQLEGVGALVDSLDMGTVCPGANDLNDAVCADGFQPGDVLP